jgi:hypothetical protein
VVNDNDDNGERAEKIETRLAFTAGKARVNSKPSMARLRPEWLYRFRVGDAARAAVH